MDGRLHKAISDGKVDEVTSLIKDGADVNELFGSRGTPLCAAISANQPTITKILLHAGSDVNMGDTDKEPPLCLAVRKQYVDIVKLLIEKEECNINARDPVTGQSPIHLAVSTGNVVIMNMLLKTGRCLYNWANTRNETPVTLAIRKGDIEAVMVLLNIGCALDIADQQGDLPIHVAATLPSPDILELLLSHADVEACNNITTETCLLNRVQSMEDICNTDIHPDTSVQEMTAKEKKTRTADKEDAEIEVSMYDDAITEENINGSGDDMQSTTSVQSCRFQEHITDTGDGHNVTSECCAQQECFGNTENRISDISRKKESKSEGQNKKKKDIDSDLEGMMDYFSGPYDESESIIFHHDSNEPEGSWNVNSRTKVGQRLAIHIACLNQKVANVNCLIKHGSDLNIPDVNGDTPLVYACVRGNLEITKLLLEAGADINGCGLPVMFGFTIPGSKTTALYAAIDSNSDDIIQVLIDHGADLNLPSGEFNQRPLINYCLGRNSTEIALQFLEYAPERLDLTATDRDGHNCLFPAIKCEYTDVEFIEKLISLGANVNEPNKANEYAIESCVSLERPELIETFLKHGSYINRQDEDGCTALHIAVMQDDSYSIGLLMQYGADMRLGPDKGESVVTLAFDYYNIDMAFDFISEGYKADKDCINVLKLNHAYRSSCFLEDKKLLKKFAQAALVPSSLTLLCRNNIREYFIDNDLFYSNIYKLNAPVKILDFISMKTNVWNEES